jgi:hypothetical protein
VLFSSHLLCLQHFLSCPLEVESRANVETGWLSRAVKNAWASECLQGLREISGPGWGRERKRRD